MSEARNTTPNDVCEIGHSLALGFFASETEAHRHLSRAVANAILAERERCAKIAENNDHFPQEGAFIAAAIRSDHTAAMEAAAPGYVERRRKIREGE